MKLFIFFLIAVHQLVARPVETFYGSIEVEEPVLLALLDSNPMKRLKKLHQYGISYYTTHREEYNRFDHSVGVFAILRKKGASLEEQIAGLLHDVSHTAFSHVGDYFFRSKDTYQDEIHEWYLEASGIGKILEAHGWKSSDILPDSDQFPALGQELPNLCADRIDYNLQGAFYQGFITRKEAVEILSDLQFTDGAWIGTKADLIEKMARFALFMTQDCWGSAENYYTSQSLCEAIRRAVEIESIHPEEIHFGNDDDLWERLMNSDDLIIQTEIAKIFHPDSLFVLDEEDPEIHLPMKFRGIDPWIQRGDDKIRLTALIPSYGEEYFEVKRKMKQGWPVRLTHMLQHN